MRAIVHDSYGSAEVLRPAEIDRPGVGDDDVLLQVKAASLHIGDWHLMAGLPLMVRPAIGWRAPKTRVRGMDVAGRVEAVGANVTRFSPGDEVFGVCEGSLAEYAVARADTLETKPETLSFEEAAAVPTSAVTALQALASVRDAGPGERVLIIGASGAVGGYAVQLARAFGAHVTGVASAAKLDYVLSLGADAVVDYGRGDITRSGERYDVVVDTAGNRSVSALRRLLARRGTLVIVGGEGGGRVTGGFGRALRALLLSPFVPQTLTGLVSTMRQEDLQTLAGLLACGTIRPVIDAVYPLAEAATAMRRLTDGSLRGKVVITP
ncbi:NAD(P)-dependent alcohol dehydrogenase [Cryobacterium lactosi]|uniref:NAD(P)-dependent alcohol dehydrogenase n=1 Tax=Cryobacterium lactosi TaxID=1259202 RepID=A0A4R9BM85_9MICO|nr:NAD(P)-dependent alcohol dehydrogenase [Cryobacterium lactosi]TFD87192.1 NAD(P)-dependent alcohol dehydrogenase [Cryobacterium lactosi]